MASTKKAYPANLDIDYPSSSNRLTVLFRIFLCIPVLVLLTILTGSGGESFSDESAQKFGSNGGGIISSLFVATALVIAVRQRYPRWWFDFALEINRFSARVGAYLCLLTDKYPSTVEEQSVHLDIDYPDAKRDLNRWLPLIKWLLAIPHYIVLLVLIVAAAIATILAWFSILLTGRYPRSLFDFVVGVGRWNVRVNAYAFVLATDKYPPFSLK